MNTIFNITKRYFKNTIIHNTKFSKYLSTYKYINVKSNSYDIFEKKKQLWIEEITNINNIKESDMYVKLKLDKLYRSTQRKQNWILNNIKESDMYVKLKLDKLYRSTQRKQNWILNTNINNIEASDMHTKLKIDKLYRSTQRKQNWILNTNYDKYFFKNPEIK